MTIRGIRGATTVEQDEPQAVINAARELMLAILEANPTLRPDEIASIFFTATPDITSAFPARAARELGPCWADVPLMDALEMAVQGALPRCIRALVHWNTSLPQAQINHVYLHGAAVLRPDLAARC